MYMSNYVLPVPPKDIAIVGKLFEKSLLEFLPSTTFSESICIYNQKVLGICT